LFPFERLHLRARFCPAAADLADSRGLLASRPRQMPVVSALTLQAAHLAADNKIGI